MSDNYIRTKARVITCTMDAFMVETPTGSHWIPYSVIHGGDVGKVERTKLQTEAEFRLRQWKAKEIGLGEK